MKDRFKVIPAVFLVVEENGKFLMARRFNTNYMDGYYSLVSGHVDGDETLKTALVRETLEEVGLIVKEVDLKLVHVMHERAEDLDNFENERIDFYFTANKYEGTPRVIEKDKCDRLDWFSLSELPEKIVPKVKQAFEHIIEEKYYSDTGW
jgi:8-oxo-dGTP diphosphatase